VSITWITPLLAAISACLTCALSAITPPFISPDGDALGHHLARYYSRSFLRTVALGPRE
jgi:hypothetical protein